MSDYGTSSSIPPQTFVECGLCQGNANISWFCKNCPTSLCNTCAVAHKNTQQYKYHTVVQRTYTVLRLFGPAKIAEQCQIHPEKDISSYCDDCEVPCCMSCLVQNHQRHKFSNIEDKYMDAERKLNDYARQLDTDVKPKLGKMQEKAKVTAKVNENHSERVINYINDFRKDTIQNFNKSCDNLIMEVKKKSGNTPDQSEEIENSMKSVKSLEREINLMIQRGKLDIIKYKPPELESFFPTTQNPENVVQIFDPPIEVLEIIKESFSRMKFNEMDVKRVLKSVHVRKVQSFRSKIDVASIITASSNMVWITDLSHPTILLYNDKGEVVRSVKIKSGEAVNGMAITKSGEIIVTCIDKKVRRVSSDGKTSVLIDTAPFCCEGVCVTNKQEIALCLKDDQNVQNHVAVYSPDGRSKLREIRGRDSKGKHFFTKPYRMVQTNENICVVNFGRDVVCVDERDHVRWVYDGAHAKLERSFCPRDICVDKYNNLLVTDNWNHCVHYIDRTGLLIQVILTREQVGLEDHWGICVDDSSGCVWVGNRDVDVVIAKYLE